MSNNGHPEDEAAPEWSPEVGQLAGLELADEQRPESPEVGQLAELELAGEHGGDERPTESGDNKRDGRREWEKDDSKAGVPATLSARARAFAIGVGLAALAAGGVAIYTTSVEAGPVALLVVGVILLFTGLVGLIPSKLSGGGIDVTFIAAEIRKGTIGVKRVNKVDTNDLDVALRKVTLDPRDAVKLFRLAESLRSKVDRYIGVEGVDEVPAEALNLLARSYALLEDWTEAAHYYGLYVQKKPNDWQAQFAKGRMYANVAQQTDGNSPAKREMNLAALAAYQAALARLPERKVKADPDIHSQFLTHQGAMKKRLGRLDEAQYDVTLGYHLARAGKLKADAAYNLAGIYSLMGRKNLALQFAKQAASLGSGCRILGHLDDYFKSLRHDREFKELVKELKVDCTRRR